MSYSLDALGIHRPAIPVNHRNEEYPEAGFATLLEMQSKHFFGTSGGINSCSPT